MKLNVSRFGFTVAVVWGFVVFSVAICNLFFPSYGVAFLKVVESIYPGYHFGELGFGGAIVATLYAILDGLIVGVIFAWLYNKLTKGK